VHEPRWDTPLRLLGGLHYLALAEGVDSWGDPLGVLAERRDWLTRFVTERGVQTNEVQRSWMLLPCFLEVVHRTGRELLDLVELGTSAGLNLVWDRYRYVYKEGEWGPPRSPLELRGEERRPVPAAVLRERVRVGRRVGIDSSPVDVTTEEGALLLKAFVWADQRERLERLDRAVDALRADPPELVRGDLIELLPRLLAQRREEALLLVYETATLDYLPGEGRAQLRAALEQVGAEAPLAFVSTGRPREGEQGWYGLWVTVWPGGERRLVVEADFHGAWLEWAA
jgi:hypothetical protein